MCGRIAGGRMETEMKYKSLDAVIENLKDAGFGERAISEFLDCVEAGDTNRQLKLLSCHRAKLLKHIHADEERINCLDYLVYQIKKKGICADIGHRGE